MFPNKYSLSSFSLSISFFLFFSSAYAFNITKILSQNPDFSSFSNALIQTHLADDINGRATITVLAVDNSAMSAVSGQTPDLMKKALSMHVVLDYYDVQKLQKLEKKTLILTTLFQASGQAKGQEGFLNVTNLNNGGVAFGSAVPGSQIGSTLVKSIASEPYNVSVLQVSNIITTSGNSSSNSSTATPPSQTPSKSPTPANIPTKSPPTATPSKAPAPSNATTPGKAPSPSSKATPPSTATAPSPSDANADAPDATADSPVGSPPPAGNSPVSDGPAADAPAKGGAPATFGASLGVLMMISYATLAYMMMI